MKSLYIFLCWWYTLFIHMEPSRARKAGDSVAIAANIVIVVLECVGLYISVSARRWQIFAYYTQLSNLVTLLSSLLFLVLGARVAPLRYLSTCMLVMTFLITAFVLVPMGGSFQKLMLSGNGLYHHTLCPILSVCSYLLWEAHAALWLLPVAVTLLYGIVMLFLNARDRFDGPYPFFRVRHQSVAATVIWMAALIGLITLIDFAVIRVSRL